MAVDKFSISLPEDLAADLDEIARAEGSTRSAVIREAAAEYVAARRSAAYEDTRRRRVSAAIEGFDRIAADWGDDTSTSLDLLLQVRGEGDTASGASAKKRRETP
jgi:predicted transcriptional regulator